MAQYPVGPQVTQVWAGRGPVLLANQDLINPVTVGGTPQVFIDSPNADVIPPLGSIGLLGHRALYAIAPAGTAALLAISGGTSWAPSPADVALQIQALGLATEATLSAVHTTLGSPAQDGTVSGLVSPGSTIAQETQALGIPPAVPALQSAQLTRQGASQNTFKTFGGAGRLWGISLSYAIETDGTGPASPTQFIASIQTGSGLTLAVVELGASAADQIGNGQDRGAFNGLPIANGDTLILNVNNGVPVTHCFQRGSAVALYSIP